MRASIAGTDVSWKDGTGLTDRSGMPTKYRDIAPGVSRVGLSLGTCPVTHLPIIEPTIHWRCTNRFWADGTIFDALKQIRLRFTVAGSRPGVPLTATI